MGLLITVVDNLVSALSSELSLTTRMNSDYRDDLEDLTAGQTKYQIRAQYQQSAQSDSNVQIDGGAIELVILHRLSGSERGYTELNMFLYQLNLTQPQWWRDNVAGMRSVNGVELEQNVERIGNVVVFSVLVEFDIAP